MSGVNNSSVKEVREQRVSGVNHSSVKQVREQRVAGVNHSSVKEVRARRVSGVNQSSVKEVREQRVSTTATRSFTLAALKSDHFARPSIGSPTANVPNLRKQRRACKASQI